MNNRHGLVHDVVQEILVGELAVGAHPQVEERAGLRIGEPAGELARELYEIFDPAALIVQRFGGTIDKYLGDGFMATFTGGSRAGEEALAAVRAALSLQQVLGRMRLLGRTSFRIGISLHTGRVAVARFLIDEQQASTTIIGRQVNIAGRLSASEGDLAGASNRA